MVLFHSYVSLPEGKYHYKSCDKPMFTIHQLALRISQPSTVCHHIPHFFEDIPCFLAFL